MTDSNITTKRCSHCREVKTLSEFHNNRNQPDGKLIECKPCRRAYNRNAYQKVKDTPRQKRANLRNTLITNYGLSLEDYDALLVKQRGCCAICGQEPEGKRATRRLHVDHCHQSNRVRGLLCIHCNRALGSLGDNLQGVMRAVRYLQNGKQLDLLPEIKRGVDRRS